MEGIQPYVYSPLNDFEIRILELLPGHVTEPISCRLVRTNLNDVVGTGGYEALSYSWGTESRGRFIQIDGRTLSVTPNLEAALHELRQDMFERRPSAIQRQISVIDNLQKAIQHVRLDVAQRFVPIAEKFQEDSTNLSEDRMQVILSAQTISATEEVEALCQRFCQELSDSTKSDRGDPEATLQFGLDGLRPLLSATSIIKEKAQPLYGHGTPERSILVITNLEAAFQESHRYVLESDSKGRWDRQVERLSEISTVAKQEEQNEKPFIPVPRHLWIDAICINQNDFMERNHQVSLMGEIYKAATDLVVWLGVESDDSPLGISFLATYRRKAVEGEAQLCSWLDQLSALDLSRSYRAMATLLARQWFYRAWIVQEYIFGATQETIFYCGKDRISWKDMHQVQVVFSGCDERFYGSDGDILELFGKGICRMGELYLQKKSLYSIHRNSLLLWLISNRSAHATDPRDKVYSVMGLTDSSCYDRQSLIIDYEAELQDVYASAVKAIVIASKKLNILGACAGRGTDVSRTWIPDWSIPTNASHGTTLGTYCGELPHSPSQFCASRKSEARVSFSDCLTTMTVQGFVWDTVSISLPVFDIEQYGEDSSVATQWKSLMQVLWRRVNMQNFYGSEIKAKESFWRTLLFDDRSQSSKAADLGSLSIEGGMRCLYVTTDGHEISGPMNGPKGARLIQNTETGGKTSSWFIPELLRRMPHSSDQEICCSTGNVIVTAKGCIGQVNGCKHVESGDCICILLGSDVPIVLRQVKDHYELICAVYIDGIMCGEAMEPLEQGEIELQNFVLS